MADFCWQCTEALGVPGEKNDFAGTLVAHLLSSVGVLCEGCGPTLVDGTGRCVWDLCAKHGENRIIQAGPMKGKRVELAPTDRIEECGAQIARILGAIADVQDEPGMLGSLVTDESAFGDFFAFDMRDEEAHAKLAEVASSLGVESLTYNTRLVDVAERLKGRE